MKALLTILLISTSLTANSARLNGAPWPTRPRPIAMEVEVIEEVAPVNSKRSLPDRIWKPGVFTVGLLSAVAGGIYYLNQQDAKPVDLATQSQDLKEYAVVNLFSAEPAKTHVQVWQEGQPLIDWEGELNGSEMLEFQLSSKPVELHISSEGASTAELVKDEHISSLPINQSITIQ